MQYGAAIKRLRLAAGLTQGQLAGLARISMSTIKRWEKSTNKDETTELYIKVLLFYERNKEKTND